MDMTEAMSCELLERGPLGETENHETPTASATAPFALPMLLAQMKEILSLSLARLKSSQVPNPHRTSASALSAYL